MGNSSKITFDAYEGRDGNLKIARNREVLGELRTQSTGRLRLASPATGAATPGALRNTNQDASNSLLTLSVGARWPSRRIG